MMFLPGLYPDRDPAAQYRPLSSVVDDIPLPLRIDRRHEMLPCSNQGNLPHCAGYATAGWIEQQRWRSDGVYEQLDGGAIYAEAKKLDGIDAPGTTLHAALHGAAALKLIAAPTRFCTVKTRREFGRALHAHGAVLGAFEATDRWPLAGGDGWVRSGGRMIGGHAVLLCAYSLDPGDAWVGMQNSWGAAGYGWRGFCRMSWDTFDEQFLYGVTWE